MESNNEKTVNELLESLTYEETDMISKGMEHWGGIETKSNQDVHLDDTEVKDLINLIYYG